MDNIIPRPQNKKELIKKVDEWMDDPDSFGVWVILVCGIHHKSQSFLRFLVQTGSQSCERRIVLIDHLIEVRYCMCIFPFLQLTTSQLKPEKQYAKNEGIKRYHSKTYLTTITRAVFNITQLCKG